MGNLHKWFKGSKSKDGKSGWVNVVTGGTCASDKPGEGTPKCVSSSKRASMTPSERKSAARRKKAADPGQQQKSGAAKPTYVSTDKPKKMKKEQFSNWREDYVATEHEFIDLIKPEPMKGISEESLDEAVPAVIAAVGKGALKLATGMAKAKAKDMAVNKLKSMASKKQEVSEEDKKGEGSGKKDACYNKVKASAKVWPSAYASGRLVQCRKKGADNYGNSKNEEYIAELSDGKVNKMLRGRERVLTKAMDDNHNANKTKSQWTRDVSDKMTKADRAQEAARRRKKRMTKEELSAEGYKGKHGQSDKEYMDSRSDAGKRISGDSKEGPASYSTRIHRNSPPTAPGEKPKNVPGLSKGEKVELQMRKANLKKKEAEKKEKLDELKCWKGYKRKKGATPGAPGSCVKEGYSDWRDDLNLMEGVAAWQRKEGKNKAGGLNEKGRKSYERENPGSDLKAPQPEGGSRKKSFCARMSGMKKKLTSKKTANDPDSRINKSLRKWKC